MDGKTDCLPVHNPIYDCHQLYMNDCEPGMVWLALAMIVDNFGHDLDDGVLRLGII